MDKEYYAPKALHHGRIEGGRNSLGPYERIVIPAGWFDPSMLRLTEAEVDRMHSRGVILTREEWKAWDARMTEVRAGVRTNNSVATRIHRERGMLPTDAQLDALLK